MPGPAFVHCVFFWLKSDSTDAQKGQLLDDCRTLLSGVPGLTLIEAGRPAMTPRAVVDNGYDVGLVTVFTDAAAHDAYQTHPLHLEFIERNKARFERVRIYDFA